MLRLAPLVLAAALASAGAARAHGSHAGAADDDAPGAAPAPQGLVAILEDEVQPLPKQRIRWNTYWKLCWAPVPEAAGYELQVLTSEGASARLRRSDGPCMRLQVAANENRRAEGLRDRDVQLALQAGQLALRVRARLADGRASGWSAGYPVGVATP